MIKPLILNNISKNFNLKNNFIEKTHKQMFSIFNTKKQLIFLNIFFKILIFNIKIVLNNNYIKYFIKLINQDNIDINQFLENKFNLNNNLSKKLYILKLINVLKQNNVKLNKDLKILILNNQKIFNLFKTLSKKYSKNLLLNNFFYKKRFFI